MCDSIGIYMYECMCMYVYLCICIQEYAFRGIHMSRKPENFSSDPSSGDFSTVEGFEGDVRVGIAGLTARPEQHSKSGVCLHLGVGTFGYHGYI